MRSNGAAAGTGWTLGSSGTSGFVGTYLTVPAGGATVNFNINATEGSGFAPAPHMNLVIADSTFGFNVGTTSASDYTTGNVFLPGGTYVVRTERDFTGNTSTTRSFNVNNLTVNTVGVGSLATFSNTNTSTIALAAADTYIQNFRQGAVNVALTGPAGIPLLAGTQVNVDLARHAFNFGTAVPGSSANGVGSYLGSGGTAQQLNYQAKLNQNFNAVVPENMGKWGSDESYGSLGFSQDNVTMAGVDTILNYAQSHNMRARMHNLIWGSQQPSLINTYLTNGSAGSLSAVRGEISERIGYYVGTGTASDRANKYSELDIYNESYHTGVLGGGTSYWNSYGATGIADIYREAHAVAPNTKLYVNEYNIYADTNDGTKYANYYQTHIESLRNAGLAAGYGDVVGGIGTQYYVNNVAADTGDPNRVGAPNNAHNAARMMQTIQNLATEGVPVTLTEFGVKSGASTTLAASMLSDALRITFGNADAAGFFMWGFQAENGGGNLFAPAAALFNVNTSNWNAWTITDAGKAWQDMLGIQDWDGNPNNGWTTHLAATVNPDSSINFTGFWGDYNIGNQSGFSNLTLVKGTNSYSASLAAPPQWSMWNVNSAGSWSSVANWSTGGVANAVGQTAYFGPAAAPRAITVDAPQTVGMLAFNSASSYTLSGSPITLDGPAGLAAIYVAAGSHTIATPIVLNADLNVTVVPADGNLSVTADFSAAGRTITKSGAGNVQLQRVVAGALQINAGGVQISPKALANDPAFISHVQALSITPGAQLDLSNNSMLVDFIGTPDTLLSIVRQHLAANRITSSAADSTKRLGYGVNGSSVLIKYTFAGDSDLDGDADGVDIGNWAVNFTGELGGTGSSLWAQGDWDYDGDVDGVDAGLWAQAFTGELGGGGLGSVVVNDPDIAPGAAAILRGMGITVVPEPAALCALASFLCVRGTFGRRRR
ncbi:MAG TPA: endo-1,4-beta-xylanase [Tepidisphaeraceae bacterium]|jgi:endo-1,4-beta-xylanase